MSPALGSAQWALILGGIGLLLGLLLVLAGLGVAALARTAVASKRKADGDSDGGGGASAGITPSAPACPGLRERLRVVGYGGVGGFAGYCLFKGLLGEHGLFTHPDLTEVVVLVLSLPLSVWIAIKFVHPRVERRAAARGETSHHPELSIGRWSLRGTAALLITVTFTELFLTFSHREFGWIGAWLLCATVTGFWVIGTRMGRGGLGLLGGAGGWALGMAAIGMVSCAAHAGWFGKGLLPAGHFLPAAEANARVFRILLAILAGGLACGVLGTAGGLLAALVRRPGPLRRRAGLLGGLGGAALCMFLLAAVWAVAYGPAGRHQTEAPLPDWANFDLPSQTPQVEHPPDAGFHADEIIPTEALHRSVLAVVLLGILGEGLLWLALGGAGGLYIDRSRHPRPTRGLLLVLLLATLAYDALVLAVRAGWLGGLGVGTDVLSALPASEHAIEIGKDLARTLGWGLGLMLCPASDALLRRSH